jgi:hypothetical protein
MSEEKPKSVEQKRDWRAEERRAALAHAQNAAVIRDLRDAGELKEFYQTAQALILCGLPYKPTKERQITRHARLGDGSTLTVTFVAALDGIEMPYGSDRTVLHWVLDRAVKNNKRFISWKTAQEFNDEVGLSKSGKNNQDLRKRVQRIKGLAISVQRRTSRTDVSMVLPIVRKSCLPTSIEERKARAGEQQLPFEEQDQYGIELDTDFFEELKKYHVKVPRQLINSTRKSSQLQDCVLFLFWRSFAAQNDSLIPWAQLRQQMWHEDKTERRIKQRFAKAITWLQAAWPYLRAEARPEGLWIGPSLGSQFLPDAEKKVIADSTAAGKR